MNDNFTDAGVLGTLIAILVAVIRWAKPHAEAIAKAHLSLCTKLETHLDQQEGLHQTTHSKLDTLQATANVIKKHVAADEA